MAKLQQTGLRTVDKGYRSYLMFTVVQNNMSVKLSKKQQILNIIDQASINRKDFLEELELIGQMPFTDDDYEKALKIFGIIQEVKK